MALNPPQRQLLGTLRSGLAFDGDKQLAAVFETHRKRPSAARAGDVDEPTTSELRSWTVGKGRVRRCENVAVVAEVGELYGLSFSPDGRYVVGGGWQGPTPVYRLADCKSALHLFAPSPHPEQSSAPYGAWQAAFAPDGRTLAAVSGPLWGAVCDAKTGQRVRALGPDLTPQQQRRRPKLQAHRITSSADGRFVSAHNGWSVRVWALGSGALVNSCSVVQHGGEKGVVWSDGIALRWASRAADGKISVWQATCPSS